jgi:hypothetical protein
MLRAHIHEGFIGRLAVSLVRHPEGEGWHDARPMIMRLHDGRLTEWEPIEDPSINIEPTLFLGEEEAHVLLDALAVHYQGASDMRLLVKDRDHERGRVDKLLDVVSEIAKGRP